MGAEKLNFWDYVKAAFHYKVRCKLLGHIPMNKWILAGFTLLGFGHPGFWLLGMAYESAYLLFLPGNQRFQKLVRGQMNLDQLKQWTQTQYQLMTNLEKPLQDRYSRLYNACMKIIADTTAGLPNPLAVKSSDLNQLLWIVLRLLASRQKLTKLTSSSLESELKDEIIHLESQLAKETSQSPVFRSIQATMDIQKRRLENINRAHETLRFVDAELDRIENQIQLLSEETAIHSDPQVMSVRLDGVLESLEGTTRWMTEHSEIFGDEHWDLPVKDLPANPQIQS